MSHGLEQSQAVALHEISEVVAFFAGGVLQVSTESTLRFEPMAFTVPREHRLRDFCGTARWLHTFCWRFKVPHLAFD